MLVVLQAFAEEQGIVVAAEFNASCPNFRGASFSFYPFSLDCRIRRLTSRRE
jgi:hypothetical protein